MYRITRFPRDILILIVKGYRLILSPHLPSSCRYTPTCSGYAVEALRKYGAFKGCILAAHRILRCHPFGGSGYDPPIWYGERRELPDPGSAEHNSIPDNNSTPDPNSIPDNNSTVAPNHYSRTNHSTEPS